MDEKTEVACAATYMLNNALPKPGTLTVGADGIAWRANEGNVRERIAWDEFALARVETFRGDVRSLELHDNEGRALVFSPADGVTVIRAIRDHAGREKLVSANEEARSVPSPFERLIDRLKRPRAQKGAPAEQDSPGDEA